MKASVGVLAYNESVSLAQFLPQLHACCDEHFGEDFEIVVVDDCSSDDTPNLVTDLARALPGIRHVRHDRNRGYAAASRTALIEGGGDYVFVIDGDGQHAPEQIIAMTKALEQGADVVLPIRVQRSEPLQRRIASWILTAQCRALLGFPQTDINGGIKGVRRDAVDAITIEHEVNLVNPEIWMRSSNAGLRVAFVPVEQLPRIDGTKSRVIRQPVPLLIDVSRYVWQLSRSRDRTQRAVTEGSLKP